MFLVLDPIEDMEKKKIGLGKGGVYDLTSNLRPEERWWSSGKL